MCPFHCPFFQKCVLWSLLAVTGKTDSDLLELMKEGVDLNGTLKPCRTIERTHLLFVNSPHCFTKWANLPPSGISGRGKIGSAKVNFQNFVEDQACLEEGNCLGLRKRLCLSFRPVRLRLFRSRLLVWQFWYFK